MVTTPAVRALFRLATIATILAAAIGCATAQFTQRDLNQYGKKTYVDDYHAVFRGAKSAIENMGYIVTSAEIERGRIVTSRKATEKIAGEDGRYHQIHRQYEIRLSKAGQDVEVFAQPHLFLDSTELKFGHELWQLDAERAFWDKYFVEVDKLISYD